MSLLIERPTYHLVTDRIVFTSLDPDTGWPQGVLTGYQAEGEVRFVLEHVIAYRPGAMLPMLRDALQHARDYGFRCISFSIPDAFPPVARLAKVAHRLGFTVFDQREGWTSWVRWI